MGTVISYLIPSYNHGSYLPLLLDSIAMDIAQLDVPAEVIIVDDGSVDNSVAVIKNWAESQSRNFEVHCFFQGNKGLAAVLNTMITKAKGDYLRLCASDDILTVGSTQILFDQFKGRSDLLCVLADGIVIDEAGRTLNQSTIAFHGGNPKRLVNPSLLTKELIQHWCVAGPTHLIKRSHYNNLRYDETSKIDDFDLFLSLVKTPGAILFIKEKVCSYRMHFTNTSKTQKTERRVENIKSFLSIVERYIERQTLTHYLLPVKYKSIAKIYFLQKQYVKCFYSMGLSVFFKIKGELFN